jgi:HAE1 family hydrophobic/amphiphilic exporter-1/multidrug efflux pump
MSDYFIDRPVFATVLAILITLAGGIAMTQLPIARFPQIVPPTIQVSATFPGADAATIDQSVAAPIEQQVNGVPNMIYMDSKSGNDGSYNLTVSFEVGTNPAVAAVDVQNQVALAQRALPQEVVRQGIVVAKRQPQILLMVSLRATDPRYDYLFLSNYAKLNIYDSLTRVKGVGQVSVFGARDYGMRIWLDPVRMAELGVSTQDINSVLGEQNVVAPAGTIGAEPAPPGQQLQYAVSMKGRLSEVTEYQNIVVRARSDGTLIRLRDVARVELAATDYSRSSRLNGSSSVLLGVYQLPDANALDVARDTRAALAQLSRGFPPGIVASIPFDTTLFVAESLHEVIVSLVIATLLVLAVVYLFLGSLRTTLIPMLAVPVSLIGTFSAFVALGFSINTLTLFALVLAIGLVVDDAIVVVEAVTHKMEAERLPARDATRAALRDVQRPVIAIALVLCAVFVPVAFLGGLTGQFYRQFALTLAVAVVISALVALSFTPALCALLLEAPAERTSHTVVGRVLNGFHHFFERLTERYVVVVRQILKRRAPALALFALLTVAAIVAVAVRPTGFLPDEDQGYLQCFMLLPAGASQQRTDAVGQRFRQLVSRVAPEVADVLTITGFSAQTGVNSSYAATVFLVLKPWEQRAGAAHSAAAVQRRLQRATEVISEASFNIVLPASVPGIGGAGGLEFVLVDQASGELQRFAGVIQDFTAQIIGHKEVARAFTPFNANVPQIEYVLDRERAKTLGVTLSDIFSSLQTFLGGSYVNDFNLFGRTFRVTTQAEAGARTVPEAVAQLYVRTATGDMVPLSSLVSIKPREGPEYIERYNIYRAATVNVIPAPGHSTGELMQLLERQGANLTTGYGYEWTGAAYQEKQAGSQAVVVFAMAIVFVFLVLAAQYESWTVPLAVLFGIPLAVLGAFLALAVRGMANDIYAQIGLVMLIGLAAKNAILIVEFARLAHAQGATVLESAIQGAQLRLRPIVMTSLAFMMASMPLVVASSAGAGARQVLGTTVVFGMLLATAFGVFLIPLFYLLMKELSDRAAAWRAARSQRGSP